MTSSSFVSPLDCLTSFLGISLSRAVSSFGRITNVSKSAITAETYIRSWRKPPEIPEVCRMPYIINSAPYRHVKRWPMRKCSECTIKYPYRQVRELACPSPAWEQCQGLLAVQQNASTEVDVGYRPLPSCCGVCEAVTQPIVT